MTFLDQDLDPMLREAILIIQTSAKASSSLIQRRLSIGYARAARILDQMHELGIIGPADGAKPREVLVKNLPADFDLENLSQDMTLPPNTPTKEWQRVGQAVDGYLLKLGKNDQQKLVTLDLEKYGNLVLVGSSLTNVANLTNKILHQLIAEKSPGELAMLVADPTSKQLEIDEGEPHLLTPVIDNLGKLVPALAWLSAEIDKRRKLPSIEGVPTIILLISNVNEFNYDAPSEIQDRFSWILNSGRSVKVYCVAAFNYLDASFRKDLLVSAGAKIVFKPTTLALARNSGILESLELSSPDEAILETMYEGREKISI